MAYCTAKLIRTVGDTRVEADCDDHVTAPQTVYTNLIPDRILVEWHAYYIGPNAATYPRPYYINDFKVGVVSASFDWRVQRGGSEIRSGSATCSLGYNQDNPHQAMHVCEVHDDFSFTFQHADRFYVTVKASNGGYVNIRNYDGTSGQYTVNPKQYYQGQTVSHTADFTLDYQPPEHCSVTSGCSDKMIDRGAAITKNGAITVGWSGWSDGLSGILKYEYEVYKMQPYGDVLGYRSIEPIIKDELDASSTSFTMNLTEPAEYCVLLTVDDVAGNHIHARRFLIFDDVSVVDIDSTGHYPLWVDSASANTSYLWQTNLQDENCTGPQVLARWPRHFYNEFHRQNGMLKAIEDHSPPLTSDYEEVTGQPPETRSREAIPNINAIVRFEVDYARDHQGGRSIVTPPGNWLDVDDTLIEGQAFDIPRIDGDSIRIWVRASDVMGNENRDDVLLHIDSSPPLLHDVFLTRLRLEESPDYDSLIVSKIEISFLAYDDHSGLHTIQWTLIDMSDNIVYSEGSVAVRRLKISECSPANCACIPKDNDCYGKNYVLQINGSDVVMPIDKIATTVLSSPQPTMPCYRQQGNSRYHTAKIPSRISIHRKLP
ncbi:uncharacterized protein [Ptychodera flava]|uniref:uncharacterized protein n=1 Tax=Ptychodera flava TaxID=63121 RepID=UPI00396A5B54